MNIILNNMSWDSKIISGEFRKHTENLSDDIELNFSYGDGIYPIKSMDCLSENSILGDTKNLLGSPS